MQSDVFGDPELDARGVRLFLRQSPPDSGEGLLAFDELALIAWENNIETGQESQVPHAKDFLKITGLPGDYQLNITLRKLVPAASQ